MYRSILLPLDGSGFSEHAIPYAFEIARRAGAVVHPVHVYMPDEAWREMEALTPYMFENEPRAEPAYEREERSEEREYLERIAESGRAGHGVEVRPELLKGPGGIHEMLQQYAERIGADLVVMTSHGRGGLERAWIGSVADGLIRRLSIPTLLIHPSEDASPVLDQTPTLEHLLVPLDGSPLAEQALPAAAELGELWQAHCTLLAVVRPDSSESESVGERDGQTAEPDDFRQAMAYLERVAESQKDSWDSVEVRAVEETHTGRAIAWEAERRGADLIALATHGRGGFRRFLAGSVADKVIRSASLPVLVLHPASS